MEFRITSLSSPENGLWRLYKARNRVQADPSYQRLSDIWTKSKKQLLIDTILNGFDVPKIYFHRFPGGRTIEGTDYDYAIIDGKQRLEAIWGFIDGSFALASDFTYLADDTVDAGGMNYAGLSKNYPDLKTDFDSYALTIIAVEAADDELIEDLFSRLNEAAPLSAAEKRNAFGGPVPKAIRSISNHEFFTRKLPFSNSRYRHFNLAAVFLLNVVHDKVQDTKKAYLDEFVVDWREKNADELEPYVETAENILDVMAAAFEDDDNLLKQIGMVVIYFHTFRIAINEGWADDVQRQKLNHFEDVRKENRLKAEEELSDASYDLIEFDRYAQSPNDAYAVKLRLSTFLKKTFNLDKIVEEL